MSELNDDQLPVIDLYGPVHKGLRLAMCELIVRMGQVDLQQTDGVQRAIDDLDGLLYLCEAHAEHENRHLHRALESRAAGASAARSAEHEAQLQEVPRLRALALSVGTAGAEQRPRLWRALQLRYARFVGDNLLHMTQEELQMQSQLQALYSTDELAAIQRGLLAAVGPDEMQAFMRLMLRAASPTERAAMEQRLAAHRQVTQDT